ncbi:YrdB family protein [Streptosporangium sp. CA-135522]|uniref:YrdB family protein n=1 Tax=Streptosporangium sp. CA-135522 TaxID=3240072 RepID=UPI003D9004D7
MSSITELIWFAAELAVYVAVGYWGLGRSTRLRRLGAMVGGIALFATVWGLFCAPQATYPLVGAVKVAVEAVWFAAGAVAFVTRYAPRLLVLRGGGPAPRNSDDPPVGLPATGDARSSSE